MTGLIKSTRSLKALLNVIRIYERGSGARLNVSKTEAMWLGAWHSRTDQPFGLTWVLKVKILGLVFGQATEVDNWKPKLQKLENHLNLWKSRSLSFVGKALIINTNWVISQVNKLIWPFLWGCRLETVSCQSCHQPILKGGLGIVNFKVKADALKLASTLCNCNVDFKSFYLFQYFLGARLSSLRPEWSFLRDNPSPSTLLLTPFYSRCIMVLASLREILSRQDWDNFAFTSKKCYSTLLKKKSASPIIHRYWIPFLSIGFNSDQHLSLVRDGFCEKFKNDLLWLIILCAVKVCDSMKNWGYINSDHCASCRCKETIDHCFLHCPQVKEVWLYFLPELGCGKEACLIPATGCLGIALPPSAAHFPSGKKAFQSINQRKKSNEDCLFFSLHRTGTDWTD